MVEHDQRIYVASRASVSDRPAMWRRLRDLEGWKISSSWIDEANPGETKSYEELWARIEAEIANSAGVVLYAEHDDFPLKGALIEAGIALGMGKRVGVVLVDVEIDRFLRPIGSWISHPRCNLFRRLHEARSYVLGDEKPRLLERAQLEKFRADVDRFKADVKNEVLAPGVAMLIEVLDGLLDHIACLESST